MRNVMTVAWRLANKGAAKFGGSPVEYLSESLKIAWKMVGNNVKRTSKKATLTTSSGSRNHKSWVAKITGTHAQYGLNRQFVEHTDKNWSEKHFKLGAGYYEVCDSGERRFIVVSAGKIKEVAKDKVMVSVA